MSDESLQAVIAASSDLETSLDAMGTSSPCVNSSTIGKGFSTKSDTHAASEFLIPCIENEPSNDGNSGKEIDHARESRDVQNDRSSNSSHQTANSLILSGETTGIENMPDIDEDPYIKLETYLEKVKHEINAAFHLQEMEVEELPSGMTLDNLDNSSKTCKNYLKKQKLASFITYATSDQKFNITQNQSDEKSLKNHEQMDKKCVKPLVSETERKIKINCNNKTSGNVQDSNDVNIWAQAILKELENLMGSDKTISVKDKLNDVVNVNIDSNWMQNNISKPEKHITLPLYSFNLDEQKFDSPHFLSSKKSLVDCANKFTLVNITGPNSNHSHNKTLLNNSQNKVATILKIEEDAERGKPSKLQSRNNFSLQKNGVESNNWPVNDRNKKGSTSTIWTSEESVLRSICVIDEDKSTSSSVCDEASVVLSSDSESWKNVREPLENIHDTPVAEKLQAMKYSKRKSTISAEDTDLLEVLSLCSPTHDDCMFDSDFFNIQNIENIAENVILRNKIKKVRSHSIGTEQFLSRTNEFEVDESLIDKRSKSKRPFCLALSQEPFQNNSFNVRELLSPSSASLHSENPDMQELITKSSSAPILLKNEKQKDGFSGQQNILRYSRSQSDRYLAEIEAIEACKWLRAAGFPQYAQMYEDFQFPIDLSNVAKDHPNLENDPLQSVYRRLCVLNRSSAMRLDNSHKQYSGKKDDSDDEAFALSENWTFQPQSRRWSRIGESDLDVSLQHIADKIDCSSKDSSPDRFEDTDSSTNNGYSTFPIHSEGFKIDSSVSLHRTGSERLKDGAKALLRRVESIKSRRRKRQNREGLIISSPQVIDLSHINQKVSDLKCINIITMSTPPSPSTSPSNIGLNSSLNSHDLEVPKDHQDNFLSPHRLSPKHMAITPRSSHSMRTSPLHFFSATMPYLKEGKSDDSSSYCSDDQDGGCDIKKSQIRRQPSRSKRFLQRSGKVDDVGAHSDSECHLSVDRTIIYKDPKSNHVEVKLTKLNRGGSLNLGKESKKCRENFQSRSFRYRTSTTKNNKHAGSGIENEKSGKLSVVRWHSFQSNNHAASVFKKCVSDKSEILEGTPLSALSCGQLQILRKLALVTLTGHMERYCPTHRSGWNWELPKFIKKIKTPDYKDKRVFGVPLLLVLQRSGHSLPDSISGALKWLKLNARDQIGLFRKSGVKSRISKLKDQLEMSESDCMELFDTYQAYDVADVLKQYFRDLPESLLTTKISETSIAIFQHLPSDVRPDAIQSAIMLLPDENREVLYVLLKFLSDVARDSQYNQMSANNLAVCFAPSIFNHCIITGRSHSVSPRRRKVIGVPDMKELSETKAMHECLAFLISNYEQIFTASREKMLRCKFGYMEESKPLPLELLGEGMQFRNWRGYLYESTSATIKEGREKSRGWFTISSLDSSVELAYKKVGDDHPLRLWRNITEIEAPPIEVLNYILNERKCWDVNLLESKTLKKLDEKTEIVQYACRGQSITDYCILRSWQHDLPRGACVIVETSIDHGETPLLLGGVRGVVLASRYLIEPCGNGRSRLMYLARVDTKGRTPEWYNKSYGHICSHYLLKIRTAFRHVTVGPESKV